MLWEPIRYLETCPSSDGACAMVLANEAAAAKAPRTPAWIHGTAMRSEPTMFAGRDQVNPQAGKDCAADVYAQAGITDPRREFDCAEIYVPFSWYEPMWLENLGFCADGRRLEAHRVGRHRRSTATSRGTRRAACCRRTRSARRACSASPRPRSRCGARPASYQVDGARLALGHAYGGGSQFFAMWVVGSESPSAWATAAGVAVLTMDFRPSATPKVAGPTARRDHLPPSPVYERATTRHAAATGRG